MMNRGKKWLCLNLRHCHCICLERLIVLQDLVMVFKHRFVFQTSVPVPSPAAGVIEERFVEDGATVKAGEKLFKLKLTGTFSLRD